MPERLDTRNGRQGPRRGRLCACVRARMRVCVCVCVCAFGGGGVLADSTTVRVRRVSCADCIMPLKLVDYRVQMSSCDSRLL